MAQTETTPQTTWNSKITTGPKKINSNIPMMGLSAPDHAPLEYPEESEEEEQFYREPLEEAPKQHFI